MSKVSASYRKTLPHLVAIQCFVQGLEVSQQRESAQTLHEAEALSCKSQLAFSCVAMRVSDGVPHSTSTYLCVLVPSEGSSNGAGSKFRVSAGRQEESGPGSYVTVAWC